jgi:hypothetical protein
MAVTGSRPGEQDAWLHNLPYEKLDAVRRSITRLDGLAAVLSQKNGPRLLQVYLSDLPPETDQQNVKSITLRQLLDRDLRDYDGLLVGFPALDILRPDLMTKGPLFYPIEKLYVEHGEVDRLYQTQAGLSVELMKHLRDRGEQTQEISRLWTEARALFLALPYMLQDRVCDNLVAILPAGELNRFLLRKSCKYVYCQPSPGDAPDALSLDGLKDMDLDTDKSWVVSLEEAALFSHEVQTDHPRFIELREVLSSARKGREVQITRRALANELLAHQDRLRARGLLADGSLPYLPTALALLAENWLEQDELDDLVAFCPCNDFARFSETGEAVRVYRVLDDASLPGGKTGGRAISLQQYLHHGLPPGYGRWTFTLPVVRSLVGSSSGRSFQELSNVLWKLGKVHSLARSLWLTAHDLIQGMSGQEPASVTFLNLVLDSALRACCLYSLADPWGWRQGRWKVYLEGSYRTALLVLQRAVEEVGQPQSRYYQALRAWYGCYAHDNLAGKIREMLECLHEFERAGRDRQRLTGELRASLAQSRQLVEITEGLARLPVSNLIIESKSWGQYSQTSAAQARERARLPSGLRRVVSFAEPLPLISTYFRQAWQYLLETRRTRQKLHSSERDIDRLTRKYELMIGDLRDAQRLLFAPAHELRILTYAYQQEIEHVETSLRELETSAKLAVHLRNQWVDLHTEVVLTLDVINQGRVEAEGLEIVCDQARGVQLLDESAVRGLPILRPGEAAQIHYHIRPEREDAALDLEYVFQDRRGQPHKDSLTLRLNVRNLDETPYQVKVNRYQFGRPIQEPTEFYGRRNELENILSQLIAGGKQNLLLRGPRRMGKTSLLYMIQRALTDPATRRFFNLPLGWDERLDRVHPVFFSLHAFDFEAGAVAISQFFRTLIEQVALAFALPDDALAGLLEVYERREKDYGVVSAALEQVKRILDRFPSDRVTVLLDEYDEVYRPETGNLDRYLREFVSAEQRLTWIIASTLALFREVKTISSPWFNVFSILELSRLSEEAAMALVEIPCRDENVLWRSDAVLALLNETGRHPAFTQLFCAKVIAHLNNMRTNYVLAETILTTADEIVDEQETANSHFEFYWQDTSGVGQLILLILDDSETPLNRKELFRRFGSRLSIRFGNLPTRRVPDQSGDPIGWQDLAFKDGVEVVEKIVNAITLDGQRRYTFTVPLFQRWLRRRRRFLDLMAEAMDKIGQEMEHNGIVPG